MEVQNSKIGIYTSHFSDYIKLVENEDLKTVLENQLKESSELFKSIPKEKLLYRYAENKWSIKEVIQHLIDTERIFSYRALAFSRGDINILPMMDENSYAKNSNADRREGNELIDEFTAVRKSTISLFNSFSPEQLKGVGKVSDYRMSSNAMGYTIAGHLAHHLNIIRERYLN